MSNRAWHAHAGARGRWTGVALASAAGLLSAATIGTPAPASPADSHGPDSARAYGGAAVSAAADDSRARRCVTRSEFRRAKKGFTKARVERRIFKARPERNPFVPKRRNIRGYPACKRGFFVEVDYTNLGRGRPYRVVRKGWYPQEGGV